MRLLTARFKLKKEKLADFEASRDKILSELQQVQPKGIRYTWWKHSDGVTFLGLLELEEGVVNPLPALTAGKEFLENINSWVAEPPKREALESAGSYESLAAAGEARRRAA